MGPEEVLLQLMVVFKQYLKTPEITDAIQRISSILKKTFRSSNKYLLSLDIKQFFINNK